MTLDRFHPATGPTLISPPELWTLLVAQAGDAPAGGANPANQPGPGLLSFMPAILGAIVLYFFLIVRPERKKAAEQKSKLDSLKKNDRVVTIGGLYGVVMNVQRDSDEVTLKVDEQNNTKIRVTFGAIARIVGDEPAGEKPA
jgi:preprotein translocase subunit YajC